MKEIDSIKVTCGFVFYFCISFDYDYSKIILTKYQFNPTQRS